MSIALQKPVKALTGRHEGETGFIKNIIESWVLISFERPQPAGGFYLDEYWVHESSCEAA
jgi:hypothetical protein